MVEHVQDRILVSNFDVHVQKVFQGLVVNNRLEIVEAFVLEIRELLNSLLEIGETIMLMLVAPG
jgi:hypothetical protein